MDKPEKPPERYARTSRGDHLVPLVLEERIKYLEDMVEWLSQEFPPAPPTPVKVLIAEESKWLREYSPSPYDPASLARGADRIKS